MGGTEQEVAFRKRRRDYTRSGRKNPIKEGTEIVRIQKERFLRPETLLSRSRQTKADQKKLDINIRRKPSKNFPQPTADDHFCLVIRLVPAKAIVCQRSTDAFKKLRLLEQFDSCFVPLNDENRQLLKGISHLIAFGVPSPEIIRQLIHTRAAYLKDGAETLIKSNKDASNAFSQNGVECLDDIVHIITTASNGFDAICTGLAPFHLNKVDVEKPKLLIANGGSSGWRGADISAFIESML